MGMPKIFCFSGSSCRAKRWVAQVLKRDNHSDRGHRDVSQNSVILIIFMSNEYEMWFAFLTFKAFWVLSSVDIFGFSLLLPWSIDLQKSHNKNVFIEWLLNFGVILIFKWRKLNFKKMWNFFKESYITNFIKR